MALQDLTPQLRTRLSRMERVTGWFVFVAVVLLLFGFGYYIYHTAERKGWFVIKAPFHTFIDSSQGLNVGDPVYMMGFQVGQITRVHPMPPRARHFVEVDFQIRDPYFRYLWTDGSYLKVNAADFLGKRQLEVTRGTNGYALVVTQPVSVKTMDALEQLVAEEPGEWQLAQDVFGAHSNLIFGAYTTLNESNLQVLAGMDLASNSVYAYNNTVNRNHIVASWDGRYHHYKIFRPGDDTAWIRAVETPPVSDQLQTMISQVQSALPNVFALTNKLSTALDNTADATSNLNIAIISTRPLLTNFALLSEQLRQPGGLGIWMLGTNGDQRTQAAVANVNTNLILLSLTLDHLADITSNLNAQVQANTNMLDGISKAVTDADDFVQGLKKLWLFRSAFKQENQEKTTPPSALLTPRMQEQQR